MAFATMTPMRKRTLFLSLILFLIVPAIHAQDVTGELLGRVNNLRTSLGLSPYTVHSSLNIAAQSHAQWMADTGNVTHTQDNGSNPRSRAQSAGYSSNWVSENIYMGPIAGINDAWNFWLNSAIHYAGMTSPNYDNIGVGFARGANGNAFALVFGNADGSLAVASSARGSGESNAGGIAAPPSYVVGVDAIGNIMHEIQAGQTLGDIALIYGYSWDEIPYMLEINEMTEDDIRYLEVGSVFLVPPQDGTYTPTVAPPSDTPTATLSPTVPAATATSQALIALMVAPATFVMPSATPPPAIVVRSIPTPTLQVTPILIETSPVNGDNGLSILLVIAVVLQVGIIAFATVEFLRRSK